LPARSIAVTAIRSTRLSPAGTVQQNVVIGEEQTTRRMTCPFKETTQTDWRSWHDTRAGLELRRRASARCEPFGRNGSVY